MESLKHVGVTIPLICTSLVSLSTIVFMTGTLRRLHARGSQGYRELPDQLYNDIDGEATKESMSKYQVRWQKIGIVLGALGGFAMSVATVVFVTSSETETEELIRTWLFFASWCCFIVRAVCLFVQRGCQKTFHQAEALIWLVLLFIAAETSCVLIQWGNGVLLTEQRLVAGQILSAIVVILCSGFIPRRPDVFRNGRPVDGMRSASFFVRYSFHWAASMLQKARRKGHLEEEDVPVIDHGRRAVYLREQFYEIRKTPRLYLHIFKAHWTVFLREWTATMIGTSLTFTPPLIMSQILKTLERRDRGEDPGYEGYYWVAALGVVKISEAIVLSYVYWIVCMGLLIPIRSQLSAIIFAKTMRKKDVKGSQKEDDKEDPEAMLTKTEEEEDEDELKNMKQGTINLLSVDSERIALFASYSNIFVESLFGTAYGFIFIVIILGWQALLAGLAVIALTTPFNIYFSKKYATAQDDLMKVRDRKMGVISEALQGIRQIKFSAQEAQWEEKIRDVRDDELKTLRRVFIADVMVISAWIVNPVFLSAAALSVYAIINGSMSPSVAFPALTIFGELEWTLSIVPELVTDGFDAFVSLTRIQKYLDSAEKKKTIVPSQRIAMVDATIAWAADTDEEAKDRFCLRNLNLEFPLGELSIICGRTGSGKSLLLNSFLGEADLLGGRIEMPPPPRLEDRFDSKANRTNWILPTAVAFVAQIPWIENGTVRDNITFGLPYDERRYRKTLHACALEKDLEALPDGELTEIGANGINLSGGQRWRVSFARAVYSRAGILILDDIFSAVDAHVGKHIFENGLTGELMHNRTRILVTHHLKLCMSQTAYAAVLSNGIIENSGSVVELQERGILERIIAKVEDGADEAEEQLLEEELDLQRTVTRESVMSHRSRLSHAPDVNSTIPKARQFVVDEERARGAVTWNIYSRYISASGGILVWVLILFTFLNQEALVLARNYWIKLWTGEDEMEAAKSIRIQSIAQYSLQRIVTAAQESHSLVYWIGIYTAMSFCSCSLGTIRYYYLFMRSLAASRSLFDDLVKVIMRAPLRWLDTVPTGRILNRFSKDFETVDSKLSNDIAFLLWNLLGLIGINIAAIYLSPYILLIAAISLVLNIRLAYYYLAGAREVKRMESNSRSPMFELFGATLSGVATIRAFGRAQEYIDKMHNHIDSYSQKTFYVWLFNRWVGLRMSLIGAIFAILIGVVVIQIPGIDAAMAGFALSFALNYTNNVIWTLRRYANVELDMNSTERIVEYTAVPIESQSGIDPPAAWPINGAIDVHDLHVSYADDLPPVLKGVSFSVQPRERVGIVGRTGAGKSSLTLALFQFIRASQGSIHIDGLDISKLKLQQLRSRLAIIPQDPVLFSGTIRSNLDPFGQHEDVELHEALGRVHLVTTDTESGSDENSNVFGSLDSKVSEGGLNLSQGQRQLLCLARAIVSRPKILVLDEATSAVDMETDALIQKSIREEFTDCTTLVIAHRLATVVDYDRILVLGDGKVLEYGAPHTLIQAKGAFYEMVQQTGESEHLEEVARTAAAEAGVR